MNTCHHNPSALAGAAATRTPGRATRPARLRVAALLAAATPVTAAVFAFTAPATAAPIAASHGSSVPTFNGDPCQFTGTAAGLNTVKWPLCAGD